MMMKRLFQKYKNVRRVDFKVRYKRLFLFPRPYRKSYETFLLTVVFLLTTISLSVSEVDKYHIEIPSRRFKIEFL